MKKDTKEILIDGIKCKEWTVVKDKDGYGFVKIKGKQLRAHRVALEIKIGRKLKKGEMAMHLCNNPPCIESSHLITGTVSDNNQMRRDRQITLADKLLNGWKEIYK